LLSAGVVPFNAPGLPVSMPDIVVGGRLKLAKLKRLKTPTLGSTVNLSLKVCLHATLRSKAFSQVKSTWLPGAVAIGCATPPRACSWSSNQSVTDGYVKVSDDEGFRRSAVEQAGLGFRLELLQLFASVPYVSLMSSSPQILVV